VRIEQGIFYGADGEDALQVFISYVARDRPVADDLTAKLNEAGITAWSDSQLEIGRRWREELVQQLRLSTAMIIIVSPNSLESSNIQFEWSTFLAETERIIPVVVGGVRPSDIEGPLAEYQAVDLSDDYDRGLQKIIDNLRSAEKSHEPPIADSIDIAKLVDERLDEVVDSRIDRRLKELGLSTAAEPRVIDTNLVFVVTSFSADMEPAFEAIQEAAESVYLRAERVKDVPGDFIISAKIMDMIERAYLIVVDVTHDRPNVYFELGYARGHGKRIITIVREGSEVHFDINHWTSILYADSRPLQKSLVERFRYELINDMRDPDEEPGNSERDTDISS
jgi:hypothetical protein